MKRYKPAHEILHSPLNQFPAHRLTAAGHNTTTPQSYAHTQPNPIPPPPHQCAIIPKACRISRGIMMRRTVWIGWAVGALILALAALTACQEPAPTPTPIPTPPPPTPTPTPTSTEQLNQHAAWLANPPDAAHWIARTAIRRINVEDEALGQQVASLPWSVDGITADEAGVLDDLSWLLQQDPAIATAVLEFPWMGATANITADERRALRAVRAAADADGNLGSTLASYSWIEAAVTFEEADVLETFAEFVAPDFQAQTVTGIGAMRLRPASAQEPPRIDFLRELAEVDWLKDDMTEVERTALNAWGKLIQVEGRSGDAALETVWGYNWTRDDATQAEAGFISDLSEVAASAGDLQADALKTLVAYDWVQDGIARSEYGWIRRYESLFEDAGPEDADALPVILDYAWVADGLELSEVPDIASMRSILANSSADDSAAVLTLLGYPWLADSITADEATGIRALSDTLQLLGPDYPEAVDSVLAYEWVQDDLVESDLDSLRALLPIFEQRSDETGEFIVALTSRPWIQDSVEEDEETLLAEYERFLRWDIPPGVTMPPRIITYPWLDDGIAISERIYIAESFWLIENVSPIAPETVDALIDGTALDSDEKFEDAIYNFQRFSGAINDARRLYGELANDVIHLPWLSDGLVKIEGWWLAEYAVFLRELDGENEDLAQSILRRPWALDGISADEREWMHQYRRLLEESGEQNRSIAIEIGSLPLFQSDIDYLDSSLVARLAVSETWRNPENTNWDWFRGVSSERDRVVLMAYIDALSRSEHKFRALLDEYHLAERMIELPLTGEIRLYGIRHTEFPADDPTLDLMEQIITQLEHFMGVRFPHEFALAVMIEPNLQAGEEPQYNVAFAMGSYVAVAPPKYNPNFHLAIFHEFSHMYWGGHTRAPIWWTEGAAGFLPDYARDALGQETLEERRANLIEDTRRECWSRGIDTISDLYHLREVDPGRAADRGICDYAFGELFIMEMYLRLGHDAVSAAMRQLYVDAGDSGWIKPITDQRIYDAFLANTPQDKLEDFHNLFDDIHGGAKVTIQNS